jgi:cation diffusion facilitator family transporter
MIDSNKNKERTAGLLGIIGNSILFVIKIIVGITYNSIAIISDSLNSFTDIIASIIVHISIAISHKDPDEGHQFGHKRAQPIAGLIVAIFTGIVGFQVITASIGRLLNGEQIERGLLPIFIVLGVLLTKLFMHLYVKDVATKTKSTALMASAIDHRNDVLISVAVLIGVIAAEFGFPVLDPIVAIFIGIWIIHAGYLVGKENAKFLMGEAPSKELFDEIEKTAKSVKGVIGLNDVCAHYVGTLVECEVHIYVNRKMNIEKAHAIGKEVQKRLESIDDVSRAFIHIDPFHGEFVKERKF